MLGLAILAGLALWCILTLLAMIIGFKVFRYIKKSWLSGLLGVFTGFMLLMGGWFVYWYWEYHYLQKTVTKLCQEEGGLTVYVTPEEWRKQIGEEEWKNLGTYENYRKLNINSIVKERHIIINGQRYLALNKINRRIIRYANWQKINEFIDKQQDLLIDEQSNRILTKSTYFMIGSGKWLAGGSYKIWLNHLNGCKEYREKNIYF